MRIANSFANGIKFIQFAGQFLTKNKDLLLFPVISFLACIVFISLTIAGGVMLYEPLAKMGNMGVTIGVTLLLISYFALSFIVLYFTAALYTCALQRLSGNRISIISGLKIAAKKWKNLLVWSLISTMFGLVLQALESLHETIADIVYLLLGLTWSVATYFVIPVLITENIGPITAIKQGAKIFSRGWRKTIAVNFVITLVILALWGLIALIIHLSSDLNITGALEEVSIGILVTIIIFTIIVARVFNTIITSGLYLSIVKKEAIPGLDHSLVESAFRERKKR